MARPRKPKYEYVEKLNLYRKRVKDSSGKYVALYGQTTEELTGRILEFSRLQAQGVGSREKGSAYSKFKSFHVGSPFMLR